VFIVVWQTVQAFLVCLAIAWSAEAVPHTRALPSQASRITSDFRPTCGCPPSLVPVDAGAFQDASSGSVAGAARALDLRTSEASTATLRIETTTPSEMPMGIS